MSGPTSFARIPGKRLTYGVIAASMGLALAACSSSGGAPSGNSSSSGSTSSTPSASSSLFAMLPASIQKSKQINFGVDPTEGAPTGYYETDGTTLTGVDPDLARALAQVLGVKANFIPGQFNALIPGLQSGRYDAGIAQIGDLKSRLSQADFVDYMAAGMALVVQKGNPHGITGVSDLCGHTVGVGTGTFEQTTLEKQSPTCTSQGKAAIKLSTFTASSAVQLALQAGRVDASYEDSAPMGYLVQNNPNEFALAGPAKSIAYVGIALEKTNTQLRDALKAALTELISNGDYNSILAKWGQTANAITKVTINNALL